MSSVTSPPAAAAGAASTSSPAPRAPSTPPTSSPVTRFHRGIITPSCGLHRQYNRAKSLDDRVPLVTHAGRTDDSRRARRARPLVPFCRVAGSRRASPVRTDLVRSPLVLRRVRRALGSRRVALGRWNTTTDRDARGRHCRGRSVSILHARAVQPVLHLLPVRDVLRRDPLGTQGHAG